MRYMNEDEHEAKEWQIRRVPGRRVISQLRSGTFDSMYESVRNHIYTSRNQASAHLPRSLPP